MRNSPRSHYALLARDELLTNYSMASLCKFLVRGKLLTNYSMASLCKFLVRDELLEEGDEFSRLILVRLR